MKRNVTTLILVSSLFDASAVEVSANVIADARCGLRNGSANAYANGGVPPYDFLWSNGATGEQITGLAADDYTVTVTGGLTNTAQATITVQDIFQLLPLGSPEVYAFQPDRHGGCTGITMFYEGFFGTAPYSYDGFVSDMGLGQMAVMGICAGQSIVINVTDVNGCPGTVNASPDSLHQASITARSAL